MEKFDIYHDIMTRTGGDIYIGVVGPVRTGKSTFIKNFMEKLVLPAISDTSRRMRVMDELPQSADGKTIMTTEPKFVPDGGVGVEFGEGLHANVRLIDSVGYIIDDAEGYREGDEDRYVTTPWSVDKMTLKDAAEFGTRKVIVDHSTVGIVVTTDGTTCELGRDSYVESEERIIHDVGAMDKPFVVLLNSARADSTECSELARDLSAKYNARVLPMDIAHMTIDDANSILRAVLMEFPIRGIEIDMPCFLMGLSTDNEIIENISTYVGDRTKSMAKMSDYMTLDVDDTGSEYIKAIRVTNVDFGSGIITYTIEPEDSLFYKVISSESGVDIENDLDLVDYIKRLKVAESVYTRLGEALDEVDTMEYSVVMPKNDDIRLGEPTLYKKGGKCGVRLKASAPSLHIMKVDISTDICPVMGSEEQCNEMIDYINKESEEKGLMNVTLFNKPLDKMVTDAIEERTREVTADTRAKMVKTMTRIVNEGKGGVLCVLI